MGFIVELEPETQWLAPWTGDPGRTAIKEIAKVYKTEKSVRIALRHAQKYGLFSNAKVKPVFLSI